MLLGPHRVNSAEVHAARLPSALAAGYITHADKNACLTDPYESCPSISREVFDLQQISPRVSPIALLFSFVSFSLAIPHPSADCPSGTLFQCHSNIFMSCSPPLQRCDAAFVHAHEKEWDAIQAERGSRARSPPVPPPSVSSPPPPSSSPSLPAPTLPLPPGEPPLVQNEPPRPLVVDIERVPQPFPPPPPFLTAHAVLGPAPAIASEGSATVPGGPLDTECHSVSPQQRRTLPPPPMTPPPPSTPPQPTPLVDIRQPLPPMASPSLTPLSDLPPPPP